MKAKSFLLTLSVLTLLVFSAVSTHSQTVITFDDIPVSYPASPKLINGYQGLNWTNFYIQNAIAAEQNVGPMGYYYGTVSASNVAFNDGVHIAEMDAISTNFDFLSAYLTGAWNSNLNIQVQGFSGATLLYNTTVVASATSPTLFTFNYLDIDRLRFNSFGGQSAGFTSGSGEQFAMDNLTLEFVPEPSSLTLATLAVVALWGFSRRKRI